MPDLDTETLYYHPITRKLEWRCKYCSKRYTINGGTRLIKQHLITAHEILERSPRQERIIKRQRTIEEAITFGEKHPRKRQLIALDNSEYYTLLYYYTSTNNIYYS
jgi:ribosomal protein L35